MIFDIVLLTFAIEIKCRAEFESCLRNHKKYRKQLAFGTFLYF